MSRLHRVERVVPKNHIVDKHIELSFETEHRGYWQCEYNDGGMSEYSAEPPFESLKKEEQQEIEEICLIAFYLTFGELPEDLSE